METAVEIVDLKKSFGVHEVLRGAELKVNSGEVLVIIGPSGSGKSTMLRCINLLEKPTSGSIKIFGREIIDKNTDLPSLRQQVGMVFQSFNLFPHKTVLENVMEGPRTVLKLSKSDAAELAMNLLRKVGVEDHHAKRPSQISGGQQQRVAIARALALKPKLMLFDEPTSALDPELRAEVLDVMRSLAADGMTMLVVTHEMEFARKVADQLAFIDDGVIVETGLPEITLRSPKSERLRLFLKTVKWGED